MSNQCYLQVEEVLQSTTWALNPWRYWRFHRKYCLEMFRRIADFVLSKPESLQHVAFLCSPFSLAVWFLEKQTSEAVEETTLTPGTKFLWHDICFEKTNQDNMKHYSHYCTPLPGSKQNTCRKVGKFCCRDHSKTLGSNMLNARVSRIRSCVDRHKITVENLPDDMTWPGFIVCDNLVGFWSEKHKMIGRENHTEYDLLRVELKDLGKDVQGVLWLCASSSSTATIIFFDFRS